jgi:hypothetical protein
MVTRPSLAAVAAALGLAGCASQLAYDLGKAEGPCHAEKYVEKSALVECLAARERPVWSADEPQTLDLYDQYAAARAALARERDAGTITEKAYDERLGQLAGDFRARVTDARAAAR